MSRTMGLLVIIFGSSLLIAGGPALGAKTAILVPEPGYLPKVGDRAVLYSLDTEKIPLDLWCTKTSEDCRNFITSLFAEDEAKDGGEAADAQASEAEIVQLAPKTEIQLLARETVEIPGAKDGAPMKCTYFAIQVLSGPFQGKTLYTLDFHITRLVEPPAELATEAEAANAAAPAAPALAPAPQPISLETPETEGAAKLSESSAPPPIELEIADGSPPPSVGTEATAPGTPAPAPLAPPLGLEVEASKVQSSPERKAPAPGIVISTPEEALSAEPTVPDMEPDAPVLSASALSPPPSPDDGEAVSEPGPSPAESVMESTAAPPQLPASIAPLAELKPEPSLPPPPLPESAAIAPLAEPEPEPSLPPPPLPESMPETREIVGAPAAVPPTRDLPLATTDPKPAPGSASSSPALQAATETAVGPARVERQVPPRQPRALISAPAAPRSAPELLGVAQERDRAGEHLEALVAYRVLERTHPKSPETQIAASRVKSLTETLEINAQEVRAAHVMKRARDIEAAGDRTLALGYFQQIVKIYPKTPTARHALERLKALGAKTSPPEQ